MDIRKSVTLRVIIATIILGSGAFIYFIKGSREIAFYLSIVLATVYFLSLLYLLLEVFLISKNVLFKYFQVIADVILSSLVILVTGTITSPFIFLYPFIIIFSSIFVSKIASYVVTSVICVSYLMVVIFGYIDEPNLKSLSSISLSDLVKGEDGLFVVYFHFVGFLLIAVLGGYLSERISVTREELGESKKTLDILQNLHENILQSLTSGVMTLDFDGRIISLNQSGMNILGMSDMNSIVGKNLHDFFDVSDIQELIDKQREELTYKTEDENEIILGFSASMLKDSIGVNHGYTIVFQDLTEIRNLEERVKRSEKMALLGQLSGGLAHEIRNPLSAISGSIEILCADIDEKDDYYRLIKVASREIERVNLIVEDFLLLTVPVSDYNLNPVEIGAILKETVDSFMTGVKRNDILMDIKVDQGIFVNANAYRLKQVFWNLLNNSLDAMPDGGKISIKCYKDNNSAKVSFSDEGFGIDEDYITRVFDPFFTTKEVGTGLGLAIVQKIVDGYKGKIKLNSKKGKGTDITITFPCTEPITS